jgi:hypothetical protein
MPNRQLTEHKAAYISMPLIGPPYKSLARKGKEDNYE